jgi:UDP-glucose 4-epimerase
VVRLLDSDSAAGRVFNVGSEAGISILGLARRVIGRSGSSSEVHFVPYDEAYADGFEELGQRRPDTTAVRELTGWVPKRTLDDAIDDVIALERELALSTESEEDIQLAG